MRKTSTTLGTFAFGLALTAIGCEKSQDGNLRPQQQAQLATPNRKLFLDVHELGPGKVTVAAVAGAHQKDLATQAKYGADFQAYWVDEQAGKIYCLVAAPSADAVNAVHKEAHGLLADKVMEVTSPASPAMLVAGTKR
jgi:hypothetical protein